MRAVPLSIEGGPAGSAGAGSIAATAYLPDAPIRAERPIVFFAFPGGGYSQAYYDLRFAGHEGYSQAAHHTAAGAILIACDHLGVGGSARVDDPTLQFDEVVEGNARAVAAMRCRLREGTLADGLPALADPYCIGMGQSMGGGIGIAMQGRHASFDALAVLGYSAIHTTVEHAFDDSGQTPMHERSEPTGTLRRLFFSPGVPEDIIAADFAGGYPARRDIPRWGSRVPASCAVALTKPGAVAADAARIAEPLLLAFGETDLSPDPHVEPAAYRASNDIELLILSRAAHMHNFAPGRFVLWNRLTGWANRLSSMEG